MRGAPKIREETENRTLERCLTSDTYIYTNMKHNHLRTRLIQILTPFLFLLANVSHLVFERILQSMAKDKGK